MKERRVSKALGQVQRYATVLGQIEASLAGPDGAISDEQLDKALSPNELRRAGLLTSFLAGSGRLTADETVRAERADRRRTIATVAQAIKEPWHGELAEFATKLTRRVPALSPRTQRFYVRAAAGLLSHSRVESCSKLTTDHVVAYLQAAPGQRNSIRSWLSHLAECHCLALTLPPANPRKVRRQLDVARSLAQSLAKLAQPNSAATRLAALANALAIMFGVPLRTILQLRDKDLAADADSVELRIRGTWLRVDPRLEGWVRWFMIDMTWERQLERRLFPGRLPGDALSPSAVHYQLTKPS